MSIRYRFVPIYDNLNEEGEKVTGFYPKVVSRLTSSLIILSFYIFLINSYLYICVTQKRVARNVF